MEVVAGPQQTPPRVSLISSADIVPVEGDRWYSGFVADSDGISGADAFPVCPADEVFDYYSNRSVVTYKPYVLYASEKGSTYGNAEDLSKAYDRAQRGLVSTESFALERILWTGDSLGTGTGVAGQNPFLADDAGAYETDPGEYNQCAPFVGTLDLDTGSTSIFETFATMEQAIGDWGLGARGMIHMRPQAFHALVKSDLVRREGNVWLSPMDNIVVAGRGYPGTGPSGEAVGETEWMYGHAGIVQIRRGSVIRLGEEDAANIIHRGWNDYKVAVQRVAHVLLPLMSPIFGSSFDSLGAFTSNPALNTDAAAVAASATADILTDHLYGWNLVATGAAGTATITYDTDEEIVINLADGESVTYMLPSGAYTGGTVNIVTTAGVTGTLFVGPITTP